MLNFKRWATGSQAWENTERYRQYLVNHEVGHVIGYHHDLGLRRRGSARDGECSRPPRPAAASPSPGPFPTRRYRTRTERLPQDETGIADVPARGVGECQWLVVRSFA